MNAFFTLFACFSSLSLLANGAFFTCSDIVEKMSDCKKLAETKGTFEVHGLKITYWVYEDKENVDHLMDPIIVVNGGPGASSAYMQPLKQLACRGRKVIRYDQGGTGESFIANVTKNAPFLLEIPYYADELQALVKHLGLEKYHLLGHSWGTVVAQEFAMTEPEGMRGLVLVGALSSGRFYIESQREVRHKSLPPYLQKLLKQFEASEDWNSPLYEAVNTYLTGLWTSRLIPMPDCVEDAFAGINMEIYVDINGPSEFTMSEKLLNWDVTGKVDGLKYPTTVIGGEHDTMTYDCLTHVANGIQNSELKIIPNAGHMSFIDNPDLFMDYLQEFLVTHDSSSEKRNEEL